MTFSEKCIFPVMSWYFANFNLIIKLHFMKRGYIMVEYTLEYEETVKKIYASVDMDDVF